ncbi:MAG: hypothetical protein HFH08_05715 [Bacilli bacterium]|nr:hypothetical protein [Bacilli bacterium]
MKGLLPADTYIVINKTILNDYDRKLLITLYQPIIGYQAISFYFTLWSYLDKSELLSCEWTHHHLMTNMGISLSEIEEARSKLEAIGLLKTFLKEEHVNTYLYELYSPLSAKEFLGNPILSTSLYTTIGKLEFEKTVDYFKIPKLNLSSYSEITTNFNSVFKAGSNVNVNVENIKDKNRLGMNIVPKYELHAVLEMIPNELLNKRSITKDTKDLIMKLSFIYDFTEEMLVEIIRNSISEKHTIDKDSLRRNSRKFYQFDHYGKLPGLVYRTQPEYLRKPVGDNSLRAQAIYFFETTSPYDFLSSKYVDAVPSKSDLAILEYLLLDFNFNPGVVNVLIDYVLKINNNKLIKAFVEPIASQWKKSKIETVEDAMKIAEIEHKKKKDRNEKQGNKKIVSKPSWFKENLSSSEASEEEQAEIEELLKEYKEERK